MTLRRPTEPLRLMGILVLHLLDLLSLTRRQKKKFLACLVSAFATISMSPTELPLPETSRKASHVLSHPAVIHRRQLWLLHRLLQVSWSCPPPVQVGAAFAGSPVSLNAGVWCVLKGESREVNLCSIINVCGVSGGTASLFWCPVIHYRKFCTLQDLILYISAF